MPQKHFHNGAAAPAARRCAADCYSIWPLKHHSLSIFGCSFFRSASISEIMLRRPENDFPFRSSHQSVSFAVLGSGSESAERCDVENRQAKYWSIADAEGNRSQRNTFPEQCKQKISSEIVRRFRGNRTKGSRSRSFVTGFALGDGGGGGSRLHATLTMMKRRFILVRRRPLWHSIAFLCTMCVRLCGSGCVCVRRVRLEARVCGMKAADGKNKKQRTQGKIDVIKGEMIGE